MDFKKNFWKDGIGNDKDKRKTFTVESVVPCVHKRVKKTGAPGTKRERGRGEEMKKWNGISRSLSAEP